MVFALMAADNFVHRMSFQVISKTIKNVFQAMPSSHSLILLCLQPIFASRLSNLVYLYFK